MKRVLSGIKPSGEITLGNYLGAMKRWADHQEATENFYFIPNLHAITVRQDPQTLSRNTLDAVAWLLAMGVDPKRSTIFVQSQIPAHAEMAWILNNYVTMGELSRMTQFKDKSQKGGAEGQLVGLYTYPALMAADILLYDADEVPVGEDQVQHVEITRDIAQRFNNLYGDTFKLPKATLPTVGARIMNLQDPSSKMSKSDSDDSGNIIMSDSAEVISRKVMRAVTDSGSSIEAAADKPAITNLLQIFSLIDGRSIDQLQQDYAGKGYGDFKKDLADRLASHVAQVQAQFETAKSRDNERIYQTIESGREVAAAISEEKLEIVKNKLGLL